MAAHLPTLRQLRYLVALAEHRHFGRAAEACFATQSTLSAGLQELESLLGATLVERTKRKVLMTPLGEEVVARARDLLRGAEDLADLARAHGKPLCGRLRLGVIPTIAPFLLPRALSGLRAQYPDLRLELREDLTARLLDRLVAGELDAAVLALPYDAPEMEMAALATDPFVLACPPTHPLAEREMVSGADLAQVDLLLLEEGHCLREHALAACSLPAPRRGEGVMGTSLGTLVQMVASGMGVTLLPRLAVEAGILAGTDLVTRPLAMGGSRLLGLAWRRSSARKDEYRLLGQVLFQIDRP
ncbi:Hydrogen peroxide-inducible genes activator [Paramagnetospirillum magnetotacticum MS-1]|uniref:Hydrogen peroxide-inducible genes activator n=1 Tax=Paramagnetospirillum magnetotacticum MS-1 TaxID=272627 RepID=A0A0C2U769_PARME|nr:hydrogen peroxide-inducible genes activator [Paramagnetospirillum magnetotacticum]KIL97312.1 Hydrogen peroxide-inducible genes activator [Paramagnetospirillum magnetotacticum MS-1]